MVWMIRIPERGSIQTRVEPGIVFTLDRGQNLRSGEHFWEYTRERSYMTSDFAKMLREMSGEESGMMDRFGQNLQIIRNAFTEILGEPDGYILEVQEVIEKTFLTITGKKGVLWRTVYYRHNVKVGLPQIRSFMMREIVRVEG